MREIDKDREWAYIQAGPTAPLTPAECENLQSMLCNTVMRKALADAYTEHRDAGTQALNLKQTETLGVELARLQGKAQGMTRLIERLFELTERPDVSPSE